MSLFIIVGNGVPLDRAHSEVEAKKVAYRRSGTHPARPFHIVERNDDGFHLRATYRAGMVTEHHNAAVDRLADAVPGGLVLGETAARERLRARRHG